MIFLSRNLPPPQSKNSDAGCFYIEGLANIAGSQTALSDELPRPSEKDAEKAAQLADDGWEKYFEEVRAADAESALAKAGGHAERRRNDRVLVHNGLSIQQPPHSHSQITDDWQRLMPLPVARF